MNEYEFILNDRIIKIQTINKQYDLINNSYIAFSGGKDSTILHYLIDLALPNNKIPRVFINTGIEYNEIVEYVKELQLKDNRIVIVNAGVNISQMLRKYGYPIKSKIHSHNLEIYQNSIINNKISKTVSSYLSNNNGFVCPKMLRYQFNEDFALKVSDKCCYILKKEPSNKWCKLNNKTICLTGMRKEEGGRRSQINCIITDNKNNLVKFHPLLVVSDNWENEFLKHQKIKLCKLYYPPYNFNRTGCKGCPYNINLQEQLLFMKKYMPNEYMQCEYLWQPVYNEYRKVGYRLKKT